MKRLTTRTANLETSAVNQMGYAYMQVDDIDEAMEKLSRYEDTGLEPEEIPVLLDRLKRASKQWNIWCDAYQKDVPVWIPVAEKLPKAKEDVLVCTKSGWILIAWYGPNGQRWHITPADAGITREDIVAWLPLPEPFNPQN
ncbi:MULTISPECIES: DUF551 domain-containing protein [Lachnospiraceae]|uniref:DUF551 domain-containing protein n=1 Tax=Lachnospiraceae TaxID=186803 RepID=UPI001231D11A|nr:DUF551 domain-containing protein [[Clostridium] symbiosum]KAA6138663.1 DUF551 domain-containing protein [[Clostridium] symbiosum]